MVKFGTAKGGRCRDTQPRLRVCERICKVGAAELRAQELIETARGHSLGEESSRQLLRGGEFWGLKNFPAEICKDDMTEV